MVQFLDVDPSKIPTMRQGRRGRVSYPLLKTFMETGKKCAQLDRTGIQSSFQGLYSCLGSYIKNHGLPIQLFSADGEIYLLRTDLDNEGNPLDTTTVSAEQQITADGNVGSEASIPAARITPQEVSSRGKIEAKKGNK